jgi:5-carboxymethyl-2-hydroxymuconate isomerase
MRLISFWLNNTACYGALHGNKVLNLTPIFGAEAPDLKTLIAKKMLAQAAEALSKHTPDLLFEDLSLLPVIPNPEKIMCVGLNYHDHVKETGRDLTEKPAIFSRVNSSQVGHGQDIMRPPESHRLDYEGEIGIVIGRSARRVSGEDALSCIAGLTCINEGTIRDWVHHAKFNVTQGKNFNASGAIGPWLVTADEFPQGYSNLRLQTRVNGELRQDDTTGNLMFDFAYLIGYLSTFTTLAPGDIIATGTPIGAGIRFDPPRFLKPGDVVEIEVQGVGVLSNPIADE